MKKHKKSLKTGQMSLKNQKCEKEGIPRAIFRVFGVILGPAGGAGEEDAQNAKKRLQEGPKKHLEKKVSGPIGNQLERC